MQERAEGLQQGLEAEQARSSHLSTRLAEAEAARAELAMAAGSKQETEGLVLRIEHLLQQHDADQRKVAELQAELQAQRAVRSFTL
jgi:chaperonin cofactor prefoldin